MKTAVIVTIAAALVLGSTAPSSAQASLADQITTVRKLQAERRAKRGPAEMRRRILQALLYTDLDVAFVDTPAREAFEYLKTALGVTIIVRYRDDAVGHGIDPDLLLTLEVEQMPAIDVLALLLDQCAVTEACDWQLRSSFLEVGTKERLSLPAAQTTRIYDIEGLLYEAPVFNDAEHRSIVPGYPYGGGFGVSVGSGSGGFGFAPGSSGYTRDDRPDPNTDENRQRRAEDLVDLITTTIEPLAWVRNGGTFATIHYRDGALVVRAPDYIHRRIGGYPRVGPPPRSEDSAEVVAPTPGAGRP